MGIDFATRLGRRIQALRTDRGVSQEILSAHAGIGRITLSRIENGRSLPTLVTLLRIAEVLEMKLSDLLLGCD